MKAINNIVLSEAVLIPVKGVFENPMTLSFYAGTIRGSNTNTRTAIEVMFFNCENKSEILELIKKEIMAYERVEGCGLGQGAKTRLESGKRYFTKLKKQLNNPVFRKDAPDELISLINNKSKFSHIKTSEDVIFISGLKSFNEQ